MKAKYHKNFKPNTTYKCDNPADCGIIPIKDPKDVKGWYHATSFLSYIWINIKLDLEWLQNKLSKNLEWLQNKLSKK